MQEIYVDIKGFEGRYEVSNFGNVRSKSRTVVYKDGRVFKYPARQLNKHNNGRGYYFVTLSTNNTVKELYVHRLVAEAFLDNAENKCQVNHIDENKANNNLSNLEWVTPTQNMNSGTVQLRNGKLHSKKVTAVMPDETIFNFDSMKQAAEQFNMPPWKVRRYSRSGKTYNGIKFLR